MDSLWTDFLVSVRRVSGKKKKEETERGGGEKEPLTPDPHPHFIPPWLFHSQPDPSRLFQPRSDASSKSIFPG